LRESEHTFHASRTKVRKKQFIQTLGIDEAVLGEVINDEIDEFNLACRKRLARKE
jgi:hypothetical protein